MLQNIRIVLVETSHTGNMGSVARAMKTMGLTNLWLVNPLVKPDSQAIALAAGASDVIGNAHIVDTLDEAVRRARTIAALKNEQRFLGKTPCAQTGCCADCHGEECICNQILITRNCRPAGRIHVILVGEELGF